MMAGSSSAAKHWLRIISRWPVDKIRPQNVSFQTLMQQRLTRLSEPSTSAAASNIKGNEAQVQPSLQRWNEKKELKQVNALYSLLENRYAKESPLPSSLRHPASNPTHYDDVVAESEVAPTRGLVTNVINKLKGMVRLS